MLKLKCVPGAVFTVLLMAGILYCPVAQAQRKVVAPAAAGAQVNFPYSFTDNQGNSCMVDQFGRLQSNGGNWPVYQSGAMLQIAGNVPQNNTNQGKMDEKTGELIIENLRPPNQQGLVITRRILINKEENSIRYIDIFKNTTNAEITPNIMIQTVINYGVGSAMLVDDPKHKGQNIAWVAQTQGIPRTVVELYGGKGAKTVPTIQYQQNNQQVMGVMSPAIGAGKEIALMHFHFTTGTPDQGQKLVLGMKESKIMASIPLVIRKLIINFRGGESFIGDTEILRGDILDVVELKGGDQLKGTLKAKSFKLDTFYGPVELTVDNVIGMISVGEFRPRQLLVTKDGEVFGGKMSEDKLSLELSSGQMMEIPLAQIARMGYRKRQTESEEWTLDKPMIVLRSGERIGISPPTAEVTVVTRYGTLKLNPANIAAINFQPDEGAVHEVSLVDGSKFAGLVMGDTFEMKLTTPVAGGAVKFPLSQILRVQLAVRPEDIDPNLAVLALSNQDMLVGGIEGSVKLDTAFSTLVLNGSEIKHLSKSPGSPSEVQVTMWDDTSVSGQLQEPELTVKLSSGITLKTPVALLSEYTQPRPRPSATVVETIKKLAADLDAQDWKNRDEAQNRLTRMGVVTVTTLKAMRNAASPEAQQRIDQIIKNVEEEAARDGRSRAGGSSSGPASAPILPMQEFEKG